MDCNNNCINQLSSATLSHDGIQGHEKFCELRRMEMEIQEIKSKLLDCHIECERTDMEIYDVNQLKDKGRFILKNVEKRYSDLNQELKQLHCNYVKCIKKATSDDALIHEKVNSLTVERERLKNEFEELKKVADENNKKLMEIKMMITIQEKKNIALAKKLKKIAATARMTPDLEARISTILNDPRITNVKNTAQSNNV